MKRIACMIFIFFATQAYSSYTFMVQPWASFLYTYDTASAVVSNISVDINIFYVDFIGYPPDYLPPEIEKSDNGYYYKSLNENLMKAEKGSGTLTIFCENDEIGQIQKDNYTDNGAKFVIKDQNNESIALAYLDKALWHLTIVDIKDKESQIAYLHKYHQTKIQGMDQKHYYAWKAEVKLDTIIDPAILIFFTTYLGDTYWDELKRPIGNPHWVID